MTVCTAHLDTKRGNPLAPPELTIPQKQANEYLQIATAFAAGRRKVLAGDFNIPPAEVPGVYSAGMRDLVKGNTFPLWGDWDNDPQTPPRPYTPDRKIDYIWVDQAGTSSAYSGYCDDHVASDHCYTRGAWRLPASSPAR
jgi:endonuclease/exonuclease/phosphatase family metal-dependent hydrolase